MEHRNVDLRFKLLSAEGFVGGFEVLPQDSTSQLFCQHFLRAFRECREIDVLIGIGSVYLAYEYKARVSIRQEATIIAGENISGNMMRDLDRLFSRGPKHFKEFILIRNREGGFKVVLERFAREYLIMSPKFEDGIAA